MSKVNLKNGMLFSVTKKNESERVITAVCGNIVLEDEIDYSLRVKAFENGKRLYRNNDTWELVDNDFIPRFNESLDRVALIASAYDYKPSNVIMKKNNWKLLFRNALKGKNTLMTGNAGSGKSSTVWKLAEVLGRNYFYINLGATQDPRASLIGNTLFKPDQGTYHSESEFVKAIQTPNSIILLDELSRAHPEAWNILMTVLDAGQRYLRLDEADGQKTIKVAEGVCFIATANIGTQYTSTRSLDRAIFDRFSIVEMEQLTSEQEKDLLKIINPELETGGYMDKVDILGEIAEDVRGLYQSSELSNHFSTRMVVEIAELLCDGFSLFDALEVTMLPLFDNEGGADSERSKVLKAIERRLPREDDSENLYEVEEDIDSDNPFMTGAKKP